MPDSPRRESLLKAISDDERRLAHLTEQRLEIEARLNASRAQLEEVEAQVRETPAPGQSPESQLTPDEKVSLFRSLFRGREDVFPRLWTSAKTGRHGYAPACSNEWVSGVCGKPKVKCGACPSRAFVPTSDQAILGHLKGQHVMGIYPLLEDDTCWLLAMDFDESAWANDVRAIMETCSILKIPAAVEQSRSGKGAHVWFFFTEPVPASLARKMGCRLITETMSRRHELSMGSYDRLFPSQDTLPKGGFGNLIALPLQHGPRREGNTVFLDGHFAPHPDQWSYLRSIQKIARRTLETIVNDAERSGLVIGVRPAHEESDEERADPWKRPPSGRLPRPGIAGPLPRKVRAVLAQRLFVEKAGLPAALLNQIKRLAAFQNPEFYKKQSMRLSTALTPRVISCAEELPEHMAIPRGCLEDLRQLLDENRVALALDDQRTPGEAFDVSFLGTLTDIQERAASALLKSDIGTFVAPPGVGKTVVGIAVIARRRRNTLILVHRRPLLEQWASQLAIFLGLDPKEIGRLGAGKDSLTGRIDVAMIQSLVRGEQVADLVARYGHVVVDECHHVPAVSFERVMREVRARYLTGLTATPYRRDGHHPILEMQLGPARFTIDPRSQASTRSFRSLLIVRETAFRTDGDSPAATIQELYRLLVSDGQRNAMIVADIATALADGRSPIVLTERRDHLELLAGEVRRLACHVVVLQGGLTEKVRQGLTAELAAIPSAEPRVILATGRFLGEGFDDPRCDTLFLALPVAWRGTLVQYAGRLHRSNPDKSEVRIFDYVDRMVPVLSRMFAKRLRGYRAMGYETAGTGILSGEPSQPVT